MQQDYSVPSVSDRMYLPLVSNEELDDLLAHGWRHHGICFFRHSSESYPESEEAYQIVPLRILFEGFQFSKSQRQLLRKNADLRAILRPARIDDERHLLFRRHRRRFQFHVPDSIYDFLSEHPDCVPNTTFELSIYDAQELIACSYLDITNHSISSTYAMFDPDYAHRSLGIYTMLLELCIGKNLNIRHYYPGWVHDKSSIYDYKKRFHNLEAYDWDTRNWQPYARQTV